MKANAVLLCLSLVVGSCTSTLPKPPAVDPAHRRPANSAEAIALQQCRVDLQAVEVRVTAADRDAERRRSERQRLGTQRDEREAEWERRLRESRNVVRTLHFRHGGSDIELSPEMAEQFASEARIAPVILVRGRTDGAHHTLADEVMAQRRARAVEAWLVAAGVDRARVRVTWQAVGDPVADNAVPSGQAMNRRVEIELYPTAPLQADLNPPALRAAGR